MPQYLGQHFLKNKFKLRKIIEALELESGDVVVEIGPGHGELTKLLAEKSKTKIIAIEKDKKLAENLEFKIQESGIKNIRIIQGDVLKILPKLTTDRVPQTTNYKIVGNIPYYITGYLFRILSELEQKPSLIVLLIQKEVAERACASSPHPKFGVEARPPKMNLLAASVQFWAKPQIIGYVSRKDFSPQPKVDSAIIKLKTIDGGSLFSNSAELENKQNMDNYYQFIKVLFKQPRKTIINNILKFKNLNTTKEKLIEKLAEVGVKANARPQDLAIEQIIALSTLFS
jgi:16S rRNA (adenine1518-N6/adenine1519-N6)-dimethyltransferase